MPANAPREISVPQRLSDGAKKRQRVSVACLACRTKRMRCDGVQPVCGPCNNRVVDCQYPAGDSKRKPPSKRYVEALQSRIKLLEDQLISLGNTISSPAIAPPETFDDDEEDYLEVVAESSSTSQRDPIEEVTNTLGSLNVGEDEQLRFFGPQSNFNLLHGRMGDVAPKLSLSAQERGLHAASKLDKLIHVTPELEEHLLELYWRWQNPWVYVVHKASFLDDLRSTPRGKHCTPLLVSAIFALSSRYSDRPELRIDPDDPSTAGNGFAEQANVLLTYECEAATTATCQAVALMSLRAMSENKEALGWLYSGMATRMAFNLGLNLDCSQWLINGLLSEQDVEVRKVTWWGCYILDKLFSMGLGRPGTTRDCDITCPKPSLSQDAEFEPWVPLTVNAEPLLGAHTRIASTSHYICENLVIASEALDQIYAPKRILSMKSMENVVAKADVSLNAFYTALPSYLRLSSPRVAALPHVYQLHIQYHVTQILLHRPLIARRKSGSMIRSTLTSDTNPHMQTCRHSAAEVARLLRAYQHHYTLRLIPIVTVHNTFTAAITHLIDTTSNIPSIRRQGVRYLQICARALHEMSTAWSWSARALRGLKLLAQEWMLPDALEVSSTSKLGKPLDSFSTSHSRSIFRGSTNIPNHLDNNNQSPTIDKLESPQREDTDDLDWLFNVNTGILGMEDMDGQNQMDLWLLDAAQHTFTSFGTEGDAWFG